MCVDTSADQKVKPPLLKELLEMINFEPQDVYNDRKEKARFSRDTKNNTSAMRKK